MIKKHNKNFIAFTLSEIMIVLLILSVISAAILPAITRKDDSDSDLPSDIVVTTNWMLDKTFTKGYYYVKPQDDEQAEVVIGKYSSEINKTLWTNKYGSVPLRLFRPSKPYEVAQDGYSSAIVLYDNKNKYSGRIVADGYSTIFDNNHYNEVGGTNKLVVGAYAGTGLTSDGYDIPVHSTIIGSYAGYGGSIFRERNILIGSNIKNTNLSDNVVAIGYGAMAYSNASVDSSSRTFSIGYYAGYGTRSYNTVSIGGYTGYNSSGNIDSINIGAYSSYRRQFSGRTISIGTNASARADCTSDDNIYIGVDSGFYEVYGVSTINIGKKTNEYAGSKEQINIGTSAGAGGAQSFSVRSINIGFAAAYNNEYNSNTINIGTYAGSNSSQDSNISIGYYAGTDNLDSTDSIYIGKYVGAADEINSTNITYDNILIGSDKKFGESETHIDTIRIGCYTTDLLEDSGDSFCIGGQMPVTSLTKNSTTTNIWGNTSGPYIYKMMFVPGGIKAASSAAFNYTNIFLYAQRVAARTATMYQFSDKSLKENIKQTKYGINKLKNLVVYQFNMIGDPAPCIGVIAQELKKYYPNAVGKIPENIKKGGYYSVDADWIIYSLAQSIKDVDSIANILNKNLTTLVLDLKNISKKIEKLNGKINAIKTCQLQNENKLKEIDKMIAKMERK